MTLKTLTAEDYAAWITPAAALIRVVSAVGDKYLAMNLIFQRLKDDLLQSVAAISVFTERGQKREKYDNWVLPFDLWQYVHGGAQGTYWTTSSAEFYYQPHDQKMASCHGLRFCAGDIDAMLADIAAQSPAGVAAHGLVAMPPLAWRETTRRPQKEFWDDLLIDVIGMIWRADLQPKNQEDVAKALLDLASKRGWVVGETAVKKPAKKIFRAFKE